MARAPSSSTFTRFARRTARAAGHPAGFLVALGVVVAWAATGPLLGFSETWQLAINTCTTIITFLMVFVIQCGQNLDAEAMQIKLDELIRTTRGAHNALLDLEELDEKELDKIRAEYEDLAIQARKLLDQGRSDTGIPKVKADRGSRA